MAASFAIVLLVARLVRVDDRLAVLIAVGSAVCGNTAIVATAPVIGARAREVAYAVATITLFGTLAVFLYPTIGHALGSLPAVVGPVGGGRRPRHEPGHRDRRRVRIRGARRRDRRQADPQRADGAAAVPDRRGLGKPGEAEAAAGGGRAGRSTARPDRTTGIRRAVPLFVLGFLALATLRTVGLIDAEQAAGLDTVARSLILVALAAVGMSIHVGELRETSWRPLAVGFAVALIVGLGSLGAIVTLGLGSAIGP